MTATHTQTHVSSRNPPERARKIANLQVVQFDHVGDIREFVVVDEELLESREHSHHRWQLLEMVAGEVKLSPV
jgi:hypothetical protein